MSPLSPVVQLLHHGDSHHCIRQRLCLKSLPRPLIHYITDTKYTIVNSIKCDAVHCGIVSREQCTCHGHYFFCHKWQNVNLMHYRVNRVISDTVRDSVGYFIIKCTYLLSSPSSTTEGIKTIFTHCCTCQYIHQYMYFFICQCKFMSGGPPFL